MIIEPTSDDGKEEQCELRRTELRSIWIGKAGPNTQRKTDTYGYKSLHRALGMFVDSSRKKDHKNNAVVTYQLCRFPQR